MNPKTPDGEATNRVKLDASIVLISDSDRLLVSTVKDDPVVATTSKDRFVSKVDVKLISFIISPTEKEWLDAGIVRFGASWDGLIDPL